MTLRSPVVAGCSGKTDSVERIAELVEAGVGAVVLKSLYEEQILAAAAREAGKGGVVYGHDDLDGFVQFYEKKHSIAEYARLIKSCKSSFPVPIIASVNAATSGEWARIASEFAEAGADAVQLNLFVSPFDESRDSAVIEAEYCSTIRAVKAATPIPVIAKIGPYFTSLPRIVMALEDAGADGIVLFNRYYSPDIDTEKLSVRSADIFSQPGEYT
ncbi:MAG: hypothetical protein JXM71_06620, partial [Spirochaetales bacterium]|nr:hypothetical protein [Spirochaetales bacterium]